MRRFLVSVLMLTLFAVACTPSGGPVDAGRPVTDPTTLEQNEWWLAAIDGATVDPLHSSGGRPRDMQFFAAGSTGRAENEYDAFLGCYSTSGPFSLDGDAVFTMRTVDDFACEEEIVLQELAIREALAAATELRLTGAGQLQVVDGEGEVRLVYRPRPEAAIDPGLQDSEWALVSLQDAPAVPGAPLTFTVAEGHIGGHTGCNSYGGDIIQLDDGIFHVIDVSFTEAGCAGERGEQEAAYQELLWRRRIRGYRIEDDRLALLDFEGNALAEFARKQEPLSDPAALRGTAWQLTSVNGAPPPSPRPVTLVFLEVGLEGGRYGGQADCRDYVGAFVAGADDINFTSTSMLGEPCADEQLLLPPSGDYVLTPDTLTLNGREGETYVYAPLPAAADRLRRGVDWRLLATIGPSGQPAEVQEPLPGVTITARFDDGQVSGSAGCNRYQGPYSDVEGALTVGPLGVTKQMCGEPEDIMPQEDQFLAQLSSAIDARASGDQLWLLLEDGSALLFTATGSQ